MDANPLRERNAVGPEIDRSRGKVARGAVAAAASSCASFPADSSPLRRNIFSSSPNSAAARRAPVASISIFYGCGARTNTHERAASCLACPSSADEGGRRHRLKLRAATGFVGKALAAEFAGASPDHRLRPQAAPVGAKATARIVEQRGIDVTRALSGGRSDQHGRIRLDHLHPPWRISKMPLEVLTLGPSSEGSNRTINPMIRFTRGQAPRLTAEGWEV